eukprot:SAG31_NODE_41436_length_276_cov_0.581921_1_plen_71_part_01
MLVCADLFGKLEAGTANGTAQSVASTVLRTRKGVCAGFARLTVELSFWCGLEATDVSGWAKASDAAADIGQ